MKLISARSSCAPAPIRNAKRVPEIFVARSKSMMPSSGPRSQCAFGSKSKAFGLAPGPHHDVVGGALADRHARMRQVRQRFEHQRPLALGGFELELPAA